MTRILPAATVMQAGAASALRCADKQGDEWTCRREVRGLQGAQQAFCKGRAINQGGSLVLLVPDLTLVDMRGGSASGRAAGSVLMLQESGRCAWSPWSGGAALLPLCGAEGDSQGPLSCCLR